MNIDRNNYEVYFIDYFEGKLNGEEKEELQHFLSNNPDLKTEFDEFGQYTNAVPEGEYKFKDQLKKQIGDLGLVNEDTIDEYSIAYLENDLNDSEKAALLEAISKNKAFEKTFNLYQKTKLLPDESITYSRKRQLKHFVLDRKAVFRFVGYASAAAIIIFGVFFFNPSEESNFNELNIADVIEEKSNVNDNQVTILNEKNKNNLEIKSMTQTKVVKNIPRANKTVKDKKREIISVKEIESKKFNSVGLQRQISVAIINNSVISNEIASNTTRTTVEIQEQQANIIENNKINIWSIVELGVKGFNKLNETNLALKTNYTSSGQVKSVTLVTERRKITTPVI